MVQSANCSATHREVHLIPGLIYLQCLYLISYVNISCLEEYKCRKKTKKNSKSFLLAKCCSNDEDIYHMSLRCISFLFSVGCASSGWKRTLKTTTEETAGASSSGTVSMQSLISIIDHLLVTETDGRHKHKQR